MRRWTPHCNETELLVAGSTCLEQEKLFFLNRAVIAYLSFTTALIEWSSNREGWVFMPIKGTLNRNATRGSQDGSFDVHAHR